MIEARHNSNHTIALLVLAVFAAAFGLALAHAAFASPTQALAYTITYKDSRNSSLDGTKQNKRNGSDVSAKTGKDVTGHKFVGWESSTGNGSNHSYRNGRNTSKSFTGYSSGQTISANKDQTLTAVYRSYRLKVDFYAPDVSTRNEDARYTSDYSVSAGEHLGTMYIPYGDTGCGTSWRDDWHDLSTLGIPNYNNDRATWYLHKSGYKPANYWLLDSRSGRQVSTTDHYSSGAEAARALGHSISGDDDSCRLYAVMIPLKYRISFNGNGSYSGVPSSSSYLVPGGDYLPSDTPTRSGYRFTGWTKSPSGGGTVYQPGQYLSKGLGGEDETVTLYAQWEATTYTVYFNGMGGRNVPGSTTFNRDSRNTLPYTTPTMDGYKFTGWNTSQYGYGTSYSPGESTYDNLADAGGSVTLYAQWERGTYDVYYDANGGYGGPSYDTYNCNEYSYLSSSTPSRTGYAFAGWNTSRSGYGTSYSSSEQIIDLVDMDGSITLYAQWTPYSYTVRYNSNGGSGSMSPTYATYDSGFSLSYNQFSNAGNGFYYGFDGWSTYPGGPVAYRDGEYVSNLTSDDGGTVNLYAVWSVPSYSISYNLNGGYWPSGSNARTGYRGGDTRFSIPTPAKNPAGGYKFLGWTGSNGSTPQTQVDINPANWDSGNRSYTANWQAVSFDISYDLNDSKGRKAELPGSAPKSFTCESGSLVLPQPTRRGYEFTGWTWDGQATPQASVTIEHGSTGSRSYTANWKRVGATVSFDANGGTGSMGNQSVPGASFVKLSNCSFENGDLTFTGWNTKPDGTGAAYANEQYVRADTLDSDTLYAQWTDKPVFRNGQNPKGGISVTKSDEAGEPLSDATFTIVKSGENTIEDALKWKDVAASSAGKSSIDVDAKVKELDDFWIDEIKSDSNGVAKTGDAELAEGWYAVLETKAPKGYEMGANPPCWAVLVNEQGQVVSDGYYSDEDDPEPMAAVNVEQEHPLSGVQVKKQSDSGKPLSGAVFEARTKESVDAAIADYPSHKDDEDVFGDLAYFNVSDYVDKTVEPLSTFESDSDGTARTNARTFELGEDVYVVETKAPEGYDRPAYDYSTMQNVKQVKSGKENKKFNDLDNGCVFVDSPQSGSAEIEATKELSGSDLQMGEFTFVMRDMDGNPRQTIAGGQQTATNGIERSTVDEDGNASTYDDPGTVRFAPVEYTSEDVGKTFRYEVSEQVPASSSDISYDTQKAVYAVTVKGGADGALDIDTTLEKGNDDEGSGTAVFHNSTKSGSVQLRARKRLSGQKLRNREFGFSAYSDAACTQPLGIGGTNDGLGNVEFGSIDYGYSDIGTHEVYVKEDAGGRDGITYDSHVYKAIITVSDSASKDLSTSVKWSDAETGAAIDGNPVFENVYGALGSVTLSAKKTLSGGDLADKMFTFEATESTKDGQKTVATGTNDADGNVAFTPIQYSVADVGTHTYQIRETGRVPGYANDTHAETVKVTVSDNGDGTLSAVPEYDSDGCSFANRAKTGSARFIATKRIVDGSRNDVVVRPVKAGEFTFRAYSDAQCTQDTGLSATVDADGRAKFPSVEFGKDDVGTTKSYYIKEDGGTLAGVDYDTRVVKADVAVADDGGDELSCKVSYSNGADQEKTDRATFENTWNPKGVAVLKVHKTATQSAMSAGQFHWTATENVGGRDVQVSKGSNDKGGKESDVTFDEIDYRLADVGTHTYTIREVNDHKAGVTYDEHSETVRVTVTDDGSGTLKTSVSYDADGQNFTNKVSAVTMPLAGGSGMWALLIVIGIGAVALGGALYIRRRRA